MGLARRLVDRIVGDTNRTEPSNGTHCGACGHPYTVANPATTVRRDGYAGTRGTHKIHLSHTTDPSSGYYQAR